MNATARHTQNASMPDGMNRTDNLNSASSNSFDEKFFLAMITHHEGAINMAELAKTNTKHDELKKFSQDIIDTQSKETNTMRTWQNDWGYKNT